MKAEILTEKVLKTIVVIAPSGEGKTTFFASGSENWLTPGKSLDDILLLAVDDGAETAITAAGHGIPTLPLGPYFLKEGVSNGLRNLPKFFEGNGVPKLVGLDTASSLDRIFLEYAATAAGANPDGMWNILDACWRGFWLQLKRAFPAPTKKVILVHPRVAADRPDRKDQQALQREATTAAKLVPDWTGKGPRTIRDDSDLTGTLDRKVDPGTKKVSVRWYNESALYEVKTRFGKFAPNDVPANLRDIITATESALTGPA